MLSISYRTILSVALPLMGSSFIQSIVMLTDSAFLSRYNPNDYIASGNAGMIYVSVFMVIIGFSDGAQILFARRIGQQKKEALGRIFGTALLTLFLVAILLFCFIQFAMPSLLLSYSEHKDLAVSQGEFISIRSFALFFGLIAYPINAFFLANGKTWVVLMSAMIIACSNIVLDYGLIFGRLGLPEMGLRGAALASTIADGLGMLFLVVFLYFSKESKSYGLFKHFSFDWTSMKEHFKISNPIVFQGLIALSTWTIFFTWIEQMGKFELAVSQNIRALYFLAFIPLWGFAGTTKTYISQYIGAGKFDELRTIKKRIQLLTMLFMLLIFHGSFLYPEAIIRLINPNEEFVAKSVEILVFITPSVFLFGFVSVYFQTINGSGNTMITFAIEVICVLLYILFSYLFIKYWKLDIYWVWSVEYIYFIAMGALSILYLRLFDWKKKVI